MKNLLTGISVAPTFRSGDKVGKPDLDEKEVQYLYSTEKIYHFMEPKSYEQFEVSASVLGNAVKFLAENIEVSLLFYEGRVISITLPNQVILAIVECDPTVRRDTVTGATKSATLETSHICNVPLFIQEGEKIKVDTRTGDYVERA